MLIVSVIDESLRFIKEKKIKCGHVGFMKRFRYEKNKDRLVVLVCTH